MKKIWNTRRNINDYLYEQSENPYIYKRNYYKKIKHSKNNDYNNNKVIKQNHYIKEYKNNVNYFSRYINFRDCDSFFPKNYVQSKNDYESEFNQDDKLNTFIPEKNDKLFNKEYNIIHYQNEDNNLTKKKSEEISKIIEDNNINEISNDLNNVKKKKFKKYSIKNIPHSKIKKEYEKNSFKKEKDKIDKNKDKKERKLSFSSNQTNESTKQSFNTQGTCSTNIEKNVSQDIKNENYLIYLNNDKNKEIKNKFDEDNLINDNTKTNDKIPHTNKYLENTEVLKVNVKISKNKIATFKVKRYDDLFYTINLFCEIYSIDEKLMKPLIIKTLCTLNTIYQIYNSDMSKENIEILKNVKLLNDRDKI